MAETKRRTPAELVSEFIEAVRSAGSKADSAELWFDCVGRKEEFSDKGLVGFSDTGDVEYRIRLHVPGRETTREEGIAEFRNVGRLIAENRRDSE